MFNTHTHTHINMRRKILSHGKNNVYNVDSICRVIIIVVQKPQEGYRKKCRMNRLKKKSLQG